MKLQSWNSVHFPLYCATEQNRTGKQLMHASHSHNYYFIKELLPLAGVPWHCCEEAGTAPRGGVEGGGGLGAASLGVSEEKGGRGEGRKHALIWVISQSARGRVTEPLPCTQSENTYVVLGIHLN